MKENVSGCFFSEHSVARLHLRQLGFLVGYLTDDIYYCLKILYTSKARST